MKMRIFTTLLIALFCSIMTKITEASIGEVYITPEIPSTTDLITIFASGTEGSTVTIEDSDFLQDGTSLELDIFIIVGHLTIISPWEHSEVIGSLPAGTYNLTVSTFDKYDPIYNDTFSTTFEVVPEPASLLFLAAGSLGMCRFSKRHRR